MNVEDLIRLIEDSFTERALNGGISQRRAHEIDDARMPLAKGVVRLEDDIIDDWRKLPNVDDSIFFDLDELGWRYYLPAVLKNSLLSTYGIGGDLLFFLLPTRANNDERFNHETWSPSDFVACWGFNRAQAHSIAKVLEHFAADFDDVEIMQFKKWQELYGTHA
jgi:hypothetical protein